MADTPDKNLLAQVAKYCNNYFNSTNAPDNPERNYPADFLALVSEIADYKISAEKNNIASIKEGDTNVSYNTSETSWQKTFKSELSIYKRVKFI